MLPEDIYSEKQFLKSRLATKFQSTGCPNPSEIWQPEALGG